MEARRPYPVTYQGSGWRIGGPALRRTGNHSAAQQQARVALTGRVAATRARTYRVPPRRSGAPGRGPWPKCSAGSSREPQPSVQTRAVPRKSAVDQLAQRLR
jgi:hypothetical protein